MITNENKVDLRNDFINGLDIKVESDGWSETVFGQSGGVPAHKIKTIEKYYERKKISSYNDAIALAKRFKNDNQCLKRIMREYEPMFTDFNDERVQELMDGTGYGAKCRDFYKNNNRRFANFEEMLESVE